MRPEVLFPLFRSVTSLAGVGPRNGQLMEKLAGPHVVDLLWHLPSNVIERKLAPSVMAAPLNEIVTLKVVVDRHEPAPKGRRLPYRVRCHDDSGFLTLVFFHPRVDWLAKQLPEGQERAVSGRLEEFRGERQITHPDHIVPPAELDSAAGPEPVYPLTGGLAAKTLRKAIATAAKTAPELPEWLDRAWREQQHWPTWRAAIRAVHAPQTEHDLSVNTPPRARLAYDELLANQLALALMRRHQRRRQGRVTAGDGRLQRAVLGSLPYELTGAQRMALAEIEGDMKSADRMLRLLQGDVGSGKTVVALLAMLNAVETGAQAALMAPTELLARQHLATLQTLAAPAEVRIESLTGRDKGKAREAKLAALAAGEIDIVVGTHALFQEGVEFADLAFAVVDEQHRFGVHQRLELASKGKAADVLVMTATPIPRTLTLTAYGDLEVSRLTEKPPGRTPVETRVLALDRLDEVARSLGRAVEGGARVYWVCPLVEESDVLDVAAAEERHAMLAQLHGEARVGLVHGRMKGPEREAVMQAFAGGDLDILVATTVIEVGVDVPEATVMVIEHAERFGLAQLHQLRGRVGRGSGRSSCLLLYGQPLSETAKERLRIMRETEDGFLIAEKDLELRGAGEVLGTRQSGLPQFRLADLAWHDELLHAARDDVKIVLETDPELQSPRGAALRTLLYLFERDQAVGLLRSG
jgi:ATP-dependent DNA helicase RecG